MARTTKKAAVETVAETAAAAAEVLTYEEIVDKFKAKVAKAKAPVDARVAAQVKLFGSVDGILYILIANGIAVVEPFDYRGADIEIDADADVLQALLPARRLLRPLSQTVTSRCRVMRVRQLSLQRLFFDRIKQKAGTICARFFSYVGGCCALL